MIKDERSVRVTSNELNDTLRVHTNSHVHDCVSYCSTREDSSGFVFHFTKSKKLFLYFCIAGGHLHILREAVG